MKKLHEIERLTVTDRRRLLKILGAMAAAPAINVAATELLMGKAYAQSLSAPTYFIEVNLRDQWDHGHVFVAPKLAQTANLKRGAYGRRAAIFAPTTEIKNVAGTRVYLTNDSLALEPHVDTIAMVDTCELSSGDIHGHEAANPTRSPGRTKQSNKPGYTSMFMNERGSNHPQGCEAYYSATPTPAALHNYYAKKKDPASKVGIAFKGVGRSLHTVYHFGAGLPNGELDRMLNREQLFDHFPSTTEDLNVLPTANDADVLTRLLKRIDPAFLQKRQIAATQHDANVDEAKRLLYSGETRVVSVPLTDEEEAYWSPGVPNQVTQSSKAQIWEQFAWAYKLVKHDLTRTVALEFDYVDVHDQRQESQVRVQAQQIALPLARLITKLKQDGIYDRTLIAIYTTDGSRSPAANSSGSEGKNTVIFAGGMIKGGYYGDIGIAGDDGDGHRYSYFMPDLTTGVAVADGKTDNTGRIPGASLWRTAAKALKIPDGELQFPDVKDAKPLDFMLRT